MPSRPANEIIAQALVEAGSDAHATRYLAPRETGTVARVEVALPNAPPRLLRIDPASLAVLGNEPPNGGALGWVRSLHEQFLVGAYGGRSIVGWCGIGLLAMLLTAVPIWWPAGGRVRQAFTADLQARGVVFHRRLHGAAGAWIIGVTIILTVTGIVMAFPRTARDILGLEQREPPQPRRGVATAVMPHVDLDRVVASAQLALARQTLTDTTLRLAIFPSRPGEPLRLILDQTGDSGAVGAIQVQVDAASGLVRGIDSPATRKPADSLLRWMHDLHTGSGIGAWWRVVASIAGLGLPLLAATGCLMWLRRQTNRRRPKRASRDGIDATQPTAHRTFPRPEPR